MVPRQKSLPSIWVPNRTVYVNPNFEWYKLGQAGIRFDRGVQSDLAQMLALHSAPSGDLEMRLGHYRSATLRRLEKPLQSLTGFSFSTVNLKGVGLLAGYKSRGFGISPEKFEAKGWYRRQEDDYDTGYNNPFPSEVNVNGLTSLEDAHHDTSMAELLFGWGVRSHRTIAILRLDELETMTGLITVEESRERDLLPHGFTPVIQVRAFGTDYRVSDFEHGNHVWNNRIYAETLRVLAFEGFEFESPFQYVHWFAETLAEQVAKLHQKQLVHKFLHPQNITLDCRLTDFDTLCAPIEGRRVEEIRDEWLGEGSAHNGPTGSVRVLCYNLGLSEDQADHLVLHMDTVYQRLMS